MSLRLERGFTSQSPDCIDWQDWQYHPMAEYGMLLLSLVSPSFLTRAAALIIISPQKPHFGCFLLFM